MTGLSVLRRADTAVVFKGLTAIAVVTTEDEFNQREVWTHYDRSWGGFRTTHELGWCPNLDDGIMRAVRLLELPLGDPLPSELLC